MNQLIKLANSSTAPDGETPQMINQRMRWTNAFEWSDANRRFSISSQSAPTDVERAGITARCEHLAAALKPAWPDEIGRMIATLCAAMPRYERSDPSLIVNLYQIALEEFPAWAIAETCMRILKGYAPCSKKNPPTPAEVASQCRDLVQPYRAELVDLKKILSATIQPELTPAKRLDMAESMHALAARIVPESTLVPKPKQLVKNEELAVLDKRQFNQDVEVSQHLRRNIEEKARHSFRHEARAQPDEPNVGAG